ncbi:MAG TPA: hypothetical protein VN040_13405, partial [Pseudosphingobacterium sp.]|nr:hypothetical protein [Pseudosphingobacterium sp.]
NTGIIVTQEQKVFSINGRCKSIIKYQKSLSPKFRIPIQTYLCSEELTLKREFFFNNFSINGNK